MIAVALVLGALGGCDGGTANPATDGGRGTDGGRTDGGSDGGTDAGTGGGTDAGPRVDGGPVPRLESFGGPCTDDADCRDGRCIRDTDTDALLGGGAPSGYCTRDCASDAECGSDALCITDDAGANGRCLARCAYGGSLFSLDEPLDPAKCGGRDDAACMDSFEGRHYCRPLCGSDSQCPGARVCDLSLGVCVDAPRTGLPLGAACFVDGTECAGTCVLVEGGGDTRGICTAGCVLGGSLDECGGTLADGLCAYGAGGGAGDYGFCAAPCDSHDDCLNPSLWCAGSAVGSGNGWCLFAAECTGEGDPCEDPATTCTDTRAGWFCLETAYPLGSAAP
jgi:hypothetical protein